METNLAIDDNMDAQDIHMMEKSQSVETPLSQEELSMDFSMMALLNLGENSNYKTKIV